MLSLFILFLCLYGFLTGCTALDASRPDASVKDASGPDSSSQERLSADLNQRDEVPERARPDLSNEAQSNLNVQLLQAASQGDTFKVRSLLEAGAQIDTRDAQRRTPVMAATHGNHIESVALLIQAGANIDLQDSLQDNPFLYAGAEGLLAILKLTIKAGANTKLTNRYGGTALIPAAERAHVEVVEELLRHTDVDVNHINKLGWTALMEAIVLGAGGERHQRVVQLLIAYRADVNIPDKSGVTPLQHARKKGFTAIVDMLEKAGAR